MVASESVALDMLGFELVRDVVPGEAVYRQRTRRRCTRRVCAESPLHTPCIFEYVYFARPDSIIDNVSVYKARLRMGEKLAERSFAVLAQTTTSMSSSRSPIPSHRGAAVRAQRWA